MLVCRGEITRRNEQRPAVLKLGRGKADGPALSLCVLHERNTSGRTRRLVAAEHPQRASAFSPPRRWNAQRCDALPWSVVRCLELCSVERLGNEHLLS